MRKHLLLSMREMRYVGVTCKKCQTVLTLDMASDYDPEREGRRQGFTPPQCPTCGDPFDSAIKPALDRFRVVYAALAGLANVVHFRVEDENTGE